MSEIVVVVGANRGIGLALVEEYLSRGCEVIGVCREASDELNNSAAKVIENIDVTQPKSVYALKDALVGKNIDILINNAGVLNRDTLGSIDYDAALKQISVNALGPLRVTEALRACLREGAKVGLITSRMGSMADNSSGGYYGYRMSKAALNAAGVSLAKDLASQGVAVAILHPGFVQTAMVGFAGDVSPATAASRLALRLDALTLETSGSFWHSNGEELPW